MLLFATIASNTLLAQIKPETIFLQKKMIKDSVYLANRLFSDLETNSIPLVDENELKESTAYIPPILQASRDPYTSITGFQFSTMRITARGLGNASNNLMVNGLPMVDLANGTGLWSSWNGLNPIFRIGETNSVYQQSDAGISILGTSSNIDIRPYKQKAGVDLGYAFGNRGNPRYSSIADKLWII